MLRLFCALALTLLASCGGNYVAATSGIVIKRSGVLGDGAIVNQSVYWIDNERVLFVGGKPGVFDQLPDGRKPIKRFLMHWDTKSGEIKTLAELSEYNSLCYDRGYVRYGFGTGGKSTVRAGPLGQEVDVTAEVFRPGREHIRINPITCREYDERAVHTKYGHGFQPLREEHGFWGWRDDALQKKLSVYIRTTNDPQQEFLVPAWGHPRWFENARGYVFRRSESIFSSTRTTGKMWLMKPDGETQEFDIPAGPWFAGSTDYGLTKRGIFMWSAAVGSYDNGNAGGYLVRDGKPERFITGYVFAFDVSPDGCKIALSIRLHGVSREDAEMVMANICGKEI